MLNINDSAPLFTLPDQNGINHSLQDYLGKWVLLYFYPKDNTPGCTKQACGIRDNWQELQDTGLVILGVSADSVTSHSKFVKKHHLPFPLLADEKRQVIQQYGSLKKKSILSKTFFGISRDSFLIDPKGKIVKIYRKVKPTEHVSMILKDLKNK